MGGETVLIKLKSPPPFCRFKSTGQHWNFGLRPRRHEMSCGKSFLAFIKHHHIKIAVTVY